MRHLVSALVGAILIQATVASPAAAWSQGCSGNFGPYFAGEDELQVGIEGSQVDVEVYNHGLCVSSGFDAFASDWSAVTNAASTFDIFQIGIDKCKNQACPTGAPQNQSYYFWAYGRGPSAACGQAAAPVAVPLSGTPNFSPNLKIDKHDGYYWGSINGVDKIHKKVHALETCWGGVFHAQILNEIGDTGTQMGGDNSDRQGWTNPQWEDSGGAWHQINRTPGGNCDVHELGDTHCVVKPDGDNFESWDSAGP